MGQTDGIPYLKCSKKVPNQNKTRVQKIWQKNKSARAVQNPSERMDTESKTKYSHRIQPEAQVGILQGLRLDGFLRDFRTPN